MQALPNDIPKDFWEDERWAFENYDELAKTYSNQWIAVVNKKVVASGEGINAVRLAAKESTGKKLIPLVFVEKGVHVY